MYTSKIAIIFDHIYNIIYIHWSTALNNLKNYNKIQICKTNYMYMNINNIYY